MNILKVLYLSSPQEIIQKLNRRLFHPDPGKILLENILSNTKLMRVQRVYDMLHRHQVVVGRQIDWPELDFENRNVLELGCGLVLGYAPIAIFLGCNKYYCIEPKINEVIYTSPQFIDRYFRRLHIDLCSLFGELMAFPEFLDAIKGRVVIAPSVFETDRILKSIDVVLSNSCLEHIFPLEGTIQRLRTITAKDCRQLHVVDFGNHRNAFGMQHAFDGIYNVDPSTFHEREPEFINLYRGCEVSRMFRDAGFDVQLIPYYYADLEPCIPEMDSYWRNNYELADLSLRVGIIAS